MGRNLILQTPRFWCSSFNSLLYLFCISVISIEMLEMFGDAISNISKHLRLDGDVRDVRRCHAPDERSEEGDFTVVVLPRLHVYALPLS
jgi:hypothetical protein